MMVLVMTVLKMVDDVGAGSGDGVAADSDDDVDNVDEQLDDDCGSVVSPD